MLLLKNETADLNQKINSVDKKAFVSPASGEFAEWLIVLVVLCEFNCLGPALILLINYK